LSRSVIYGLIRATRGVGSWNLSGYRPASTSGRLHGCSPHVGRALAPRQRPHHARSIKADRLAKLDQLHHVDATLAGFHMCDPGLIDADLLRQIDLPETRFFRCSTSMAASFFWSGELTVLGIKPSSLT